MKRAEASPAHLSVRVRVPLPSFELDVNLSFDAARTGLFGASGTGKTTLLEVIAGWRRDARGEVSFAGTPWLGERSWVPPERRAIGYVPQDGLLFPHLSVRQNLLVGSARASGGPPSLGVEEAAELLDIEPLLDRRTAGLSGGERQRVALGRALCSRPRLLLLDEPFGALDLPLRRRLLPLLERVAAATSVPLVIVSHDPSELAALCDEVVVLSRGKVVAQGPARALLTDPDLHGAATNGYDNVLLALVEDVEGEMARVRVGDGVALTVRCGELSVGQSLVVSLRAVDIMVGLEPPQRLSARNVHLAKVESIRGTRRRWVTAVVAPDTRLVVELTDAACAQLELTEGREVYLVFKATSCRVSHARS